MIEKISNNLQLGLRHNTVGSKNYDKKNFINVLNDKIKEVNNLQKNAGKLAEDFALGKTDNIHQVMISSEKAKIAMNLTLAIQNKVIDAYKEIMRIQV